ncbi:MAG: hypothetical protein ACK4NW_03145 [Roseinatronobacter sp.]
MQPKHTHTRKVLAAAVTVPLVLAACLAPTDLPPRTASFSGESPGLLPLSQIIDRAADTPNTARLTAGPDVRIAALQARAARLRGPVISPAERQRLLGARDRLR